MNHEGSDIFAVCLRRDGMVLFESGSCGSSFLVVLEFLISRKSEHVIATFHALDQCKADDRPLIIR